MIVVLGGLGKWVYVDGGYRQLALNAQGVWTLLPSALTQPPPPPVPPESFQGPSWTRGPTLPVEGPVWTCPAQQLHPVQQSVPEQVPGGSGFFTPPQIPEDLSGLPKGLVEFVGMGGPPSYRPAPMPHHVEQVAPARQCTQGYGGLVGSSLHQVAPTPMPYPVEQSSPGMQCAQGLGSSPGGSLLHQVPLMPYPQYPVEQSVPGLQSTLGYDRGLNYLSLHQAAPPHHHDEQAVMPNSSLSPVPPPPPSGLGPDYGVRQEIGFRVDRTPGGTPVPPLPPPLTPTPVSETRRQELRYSPQWQRWHDLPQLSELRTDEAPIVVGDWITLVGPIVGDISTGAGLWWSKIRNRAEAFYAQWLNATPLHRAQIEVTLGSELSQPQYARLEQRVTSMLLASLPQNLKQDILASRVLSSVNVLFRVMVAGQPGGTAERATLLNFLTQPGTAQNPADALEKLRKYSRWRSRAEQLKVSLPDPSLLLRAVENIVAGIVSSSTYRELAFRLSVLKLELSLDHVPTHEKVEKFRFMPGWSCLL